MKELQTINFKKSESFIEITDIIDSQKSNYKSVKEVIKNLQIKDLQNDIIRLKQKQDAINSLFKSFTSFCVGFCEQANGNISWATVELYYSIFYMMRTYLYFNGFSILYFENKQYIYDCDAKIFSNVSYNTHECVFKIYKKNFIGSDKLINKLCFENCTMDAYDYFEGLRNIVNYRAVDFSEPNEYVFWDCIKKCDNIDELIGNIISDKSFSYINEEYVILALPIYCITKLFNDYFEEYLTLPNDKKEYLYKIICNNFELKYCIENIEHYYGINII